MTDFLKRAIQAYKDQGGVLPQLTDEQLQQVADDMVAKAKAMRVPLEVQGACPHSMVERVTRREYWCVDCHQRVYPDPDWFDKGFLLYGGAK